MFLNGIRILDWCSIYFLIGGDLGWEGGVGGQVFEFGRVSRGVYILSDEVSKIDNFQFSNPSSEYLRQV